MKKVYLIKDMNTGRYLTHDYDNRWDLNHNDAMQFETEDLAAETIDSNIEHEFSDVFDGMKYLKITQLIII